tara:strand:+ start:8327 stop:8584 length:258 start_codon:yes stop_codon:yes gene_type:complete
LHHPQNRDSFLGMIRSASLLLVVGLIGAGCTSSREYGMETSPLVQELDGKDHANELEEQITQENLRAQEDQDEPIFTYDDSGSPE